MGNVFKFLLKGAAWVPALIQLAIETVKLARDWINRKRGKDADRK